jgi:multiple sugar transport system permease protein
MSEISNQKNLKKYSVVPLQAGNWQSLLSVGGKVLLYCIIIISSLTMLLPFIWMLSSSFKTSLQVFEFPIKWIPEHPVFGNYQYVWNKLHYAVLLFNTIKLTAIITFLQLATCSLAAYAFSKIQFPERDKLFLAYLATMMVPYQVLMIPQFLIVKSLHLNTDPHLAIILIEAFSPFGVFLLRQFYMGIPNEISEAARIDGLSEFGIYAKILLPLSKPALASLGIFTAVTVWNDFLTPLIYINSSAQYTIQLGLRSLFGEYSTDYAVIMAGAVISIVPIIIVFLFAQKYFEEGIAMTGLKG